MDLLSIPHMPDWGAMPPVSLTSPPHRGGEPGSERDRRPESHRLRWPSGSCAPRRLFPRPAVLTFLNRALWVPVGAQGMPHFPTVSDIKCQRDTKEPTRRGARSKKRVLFLMSDPVNTPNSAQACPSIVINKL